MHKLVRQGGAIRALGPLVFRLILVVGGGLIWQMEARPVLAQGADAGAATDEELGQPPEEAPAAAPPAGNQIGRASCRERV